MKISLDETIIRAIDHGDAEAAGLVADALRSQGATYRAILTRVQRVRPIVTQAEWDRLLAESESDA